MKDKNFYGYPLWHWYILGVFCLLFLPVLMLSGEQSSSDSKSKYRLVYTGHDRDGSYNAGYLPLDSKAECEKIKREFESDNDSASDVRYTYHCERL